MEAANSSSGPRRSRISSRRRALSLRARRMIASVKDSFPSLIISKARYASSETVIDLWGITCVMFLTHIRVSTWDPHDESRGTGVATAYGGCGPRHCRTPETGRGRAITIRTVLGTGLLGFVSLHVFCFQS